jgi:hypothetical protein
MKIQFNFSGAPTRLSIQCGFTALDCSNVQIKIAAFKNFNQIWNECVVIPTIINCLLEVL